jgi:hypothetical protein
LKIHIEQITHKLRAAGYAVRSANPYIWQETLKMVYCIYFHSIMNCGLIFWGKSSHGIEIFKIWKHIVRIMAEYRSRDV